MFQRKFILESWILVIVVLFIVFHFILAYHNVLVADSHEFLYQYNYKGLWGSVNHYYTTWQGSVSAYFFINLFFIINKYLNGFLVLNFFIVSLFVVGLYLLISNIFIRVGIQLTRVSILLMSSYLFVLFQEITADKSILFWLDETAMIYIGMGFSIIGFALIFSKSINFFNLILIFSFFFIGGSCVENFALVCFGILGLLAIIQFFIPDNPFFYKTRSKIYLGVIGCLVGLIIMLTCPGLEIRRDSFARPDFFESILIAVNSTYHFYKFYLLPNLGKIVFAVAPFVIWGLNLSDNKSVKEHSKLFLLFLVIFIALVLIVYGSFLIMAFGTGGMGQPRTLNHIFIYIIITFSVLAFLFGYYVQIRRNVALLFSGLGLLILTISLMQNYGRALPESIKFSQSAKARSTYLLSENHKGRTELLALDSLYFNEYVIYHSDEITTDSLSWENLALKNELGLNFNIVVKNGERKISRQVD